MTKKQIALIVLDGWGYREDKKDNAIAEAQKNGGTCAIIDAEHAFDASYAKKLGVNVDDLLIAQPALIPVTRATKIGTVISY